MANESSSMSLLEKTQALMEVERSLTEQLEKVEPWLTRNTYNSVAATSNQQHYSKRVRPIPTTMEQVRQILAIGRNYASRTSAPAGWNPNAPVVGFSTPNPLPHQLRGGALAALELERARQAENDKKRKRKKEEEEAAKAKKMEEEETQQQQASSNNNANKPANAEQGARPDNKKVAAAGGGQNNPGRGRWSQTPVAVTTMNLSDSDSSSDDDDDDSD